MGVAWVLARVLLASAALPAAHAGIVVVYESGVEAYEEALAGLESTMASNPPRVVDLRAAESDLTRVLSGRDVQLVVAIGSRALGEIQSRKVVAPTVATMILHSAVLHSGEEGGARVELDIPLSGQLAAMRSLWPQRLRIGIVRNPARSRYSAEELEARARKEGYTALVMDCDGPAGLLRVVAAMKGKVDFLLCFPDPDLYNPMTVKPLVMASLEDRLPIVGFSPAFVRAGAVAGIYPDYRETGRQTGEMAQRLLRGDNRIASETPRKIQMAVNQRVARLLGVDFHSAGLPVEVFR